MHRPQKLPALFVTFLLILAAHPAVAQDDFEDVEIETVRVAENVYMLTGRGGNMGLSVGDDGAFLIDDQFAPLSDKIQAAVAERTEQPIQFVVNTHWHGDHTGGNEEMGEAGALLVAHENVRKRMSTEQFMEAFDRRVPAAPEAALPVITFTDSISFYWNDDTLRVFHVDPAHTDGDAVIHFTRANVVHAGDVFFNGTYPFVDASSGGALDGVVEAAGRILAVTDADTQIIPGHGPLAIRADLQAYHDMLATVRDRIQRLVAEGKTVDEIVAAKPTAEFDAAWGNGSMQPDQWVRLALSTMHE